MFNQLTYILEDDGETVAAHIPELDGCFTEGNNLEDALDKLQKARDVWLEGFFDGMRDAEKERNG